MSARQKIDGWIAVGVVCACLMAGFRPMTGAGEELFMPDLYYRLGTNVVTPHIAWAKPYARGKVKALVIGQRWSQRETVELMERMAIECTPFFTYSVGALHHSGGTDFGLENVTRIQKEAVLKELDRVLDDTYDVIIMGGFVAVVFSQPVVDKLIAKVKGGTGLVYCWPGHAEDIGLLKVLFGSNTSFTGKTSDPGPAETTGRSPRLDGKDKAAMDPIIQGIPMEGLAGFGVTACAGNIDSVIKLFNLGQGRVVVVNYGGGSYYGGISGAHFLTPTDSNDLNYEYYQSFIIKAVLWAAGKEPRLQFAEFPVVVAGNTLAFKLDNQDRPEEVAIRLAVRSPDALARIPELPLPAPGVQQTASLIRPLHEEQRNVALPIGMTSLQFALPAFPAGQYVADVEVSDKGQKINWASAIWNVTNPAVISGLKLVPDVLDAAKGESRIQCELTLTVPTGAGALVNLAVIDSHDRVLDRKSVPVKDNGTTLKAELSAANILSTLGRVRAELVVAGQTAGITTACFSVRHRPWDDFTFFSWGQIGREYVGRQRGRVVAGLGVDALRGVGALEQYQVADIRHIGDVNRFASQVKDKMLTPCYNDPKYRAELEATIKKVMSADVPYGGARFQHFAYVHGSDFTYCGGGDACWCSNCIPAFRKYLAGVYGTIAALNREWDSAYAAFETIQPITKAEMDAKAKTKGNYAPLIDQWLFNYRSFADIFKFGSDVIKGIDPSVGHGWCTALWNWPNCGYDWAEIMKVCDFAAPYGPWGEDTEHIEIPRSFARPGTTLSMTYGAYVLRGRIVNVDYQRAAPYGILFSGFNNAFWYSTSGTEESGIAPTLDLFPCLEAGAAAIRNIKRGLGKLILGARRQDDGIAIHYSLPSYLFSFLASGPHVAWRRNDYTEALDALGYRYDFVSDEQIAAGKLKNYRALVMPVSQCVGAAQALRLREFVQNGGVLFADLRPGVADEHGKPADNSIMPELFGLKWKQPLSPLKDLTNIAIKGTFSGKVFAAPAVAKLPVDGSVALNGAQAAFTVADVPLVTRQATGKGAAVCLNAFPGSESGREYLSMLLRTVFAAQGIEPSIFPARSGGQFQPDVGIQGLRFRGFSDGAARYYGIVRGDGLPAKAAPEPFRLELGTNGFLYDMLAGVCLGSASQWSSTIAPYQVYALALLPYRVKGLKVKPAGEQFRPGAEIAGGIELVVDAQAPVRHVINLRVFRPDGLECGYLMQNLELTGGKNSFIIPMAFNEPSGLWNLAFTDVASGVQQALKVTVK